MKTKMRLMASATIIITALGLPSISWAMEADQTSCPKSVSYKTSDARDNQSAGLANFHYLKHFSATQEYRESVNTLREKLFVLGKKIEEFKINNKNSEEIEDRIANLQANIETQQNLCSSYSNKEAAGLEIQNKIEDLKITIRNEENNPILGNGIQRLRNKVTELEEEALKLEKRPGVLAQTLNLYKDSLDKLRKETINSSEISNDMKEKEKELIDLYTAHAKGLCSQDAASQDSPKSIFKKLGVENSQLENIKDESLFRLFARTMERPYLSIDSAEDKDQAYVKGLEELLQYFNNRIADNITCLDLGISFYPVHTMHFDFVDDAKAVDALLIDRNKFYEVQENRNKESDVISLTNILSSYAKIGTNSHALLSKFTDEFPSGFLGLCITSLETSPINMLADYMNKSLLTKMYEGKGPQDHSKILIETVYSILRLHINKVALNINNVSLDKILKTAKGDVEKSDTQTFESLTEAYY